MIQQIIYSAKLIILMIQQIQVSTILNSAAETPTEHVS